jgi:hypothetical protein
MTPTFCEECGAPTQVGAQFCEECGAPIATTPVRASDPPTPQPTLSNVAPPRVDSQEPGSNERSTRSDRPMVQASQASQPSPPTQAGSHDTSSSPQTNSQLGGADLEERLFHWLLSEFKNAEGIDLTTDDFAVRRLKDGAKQGNRQLSTAPETEINLPFIAVDRTGTPLHIRVRVTRATLEQLE